MRLLFLFTEGLDTPSPYNHLMLALIEDTAKAIDKIDMIQSEREKKNESFPESLRKYRNINNVSIERKVIEKKNFPKRYLEEFFFHFKSFYKWIKFEAPDVIFVQSSPTAFLPILLSKIFSKAKIVYSVQDVFPGTALATGVLNKGILSQIFKQIQKIAYRLSDVITVISEDMKDTVLEESSIPENRVITIRNWFDSRNIQYIEWDNNKFVEKYSLVKENFYIQYAGSFVNVFDYETVVNIAEKLKQYGDIKFHMIGNGVAKENFIKLCNQRNLENIIFFDLEPSHMVPHVYSYCDMAIIPLKKGVIYNSVPSKLGLLMKCFRPVLSLVDYDSKYVNEILNNEIGLAVETGDVDNAVKKILEIYKNRDLINFYGKKANYYAISEFDRYVNTNKFIEIFKSNS